MRWALLVAVGCLAGCGGGQPGGPAVTAAPSATVKIAGTKMSAQEVADAAIGAPLNGGPHPELVPLPKSAFTRPIARYRAYSRRQAAAMGGQAAALRPAPRAGDRAAAGRGRAPAGEGHPPVR